MDLSADETQALDLFQSAGSLEQKGDYKGAISLYKKAYEVDKQVDRLYRKLVTLQIAEEKANAKTNDSQVTQDETEESTEPTIEDPNALSPISVLPSELLGKVLAYLAHDSARDYKRAVRSSRLFWFPQNSSLFWEPLCRLQYTGVDDKISQYGSWVEMFRNRAHLRFNGVYISTCTYLRHGEQEGGSWYPPVIEVTYYRYLRFHEDGTVEVLLSNSPPESALPLRSRKVARGFWTLDEDKNWLEISVQGPIPEYDYHMHFKVVSSGGKLHNKLRWERYWSMNSKNGQQDDFSLKHEKAFYFHKS